jgi:transcription antitermination factor NusG
LGTDPFDEAGGGARWFALYTTCRHEKRVALHLSQREIEHYLPLYIAPRKWRDGSRVVLELPLFPCYVFVRIQKSQRGRLLSTPGALCMVAGMGGSPAPLSNSIIDALKSQIAHKKIEPHPLLTVGQRVRIRSGAFAGISGIIVRKKNGFRVVLTLEQIMQSIALEVDEDEVESSESRLQNISIPVDLSLQRA